MRVVAHIGGAIGSAGRAVVISCVALLCVIAYSFGSLRRLAIRDPVARAQHRASQRGRLLRWSFARLGATFVKIGQVASSRPDLFSPGVIAELRTLQDHVPPFSYRAVRGIIARELGAPIEARFRSFDPVPLAAGSIAQVHRAVMLDGEEVAVKVVRPGVRARAARDARLLLWLAHVAHAVSARARAGDAIGHARSLIAGIMAQTELRYEARNYKRFRRETFGSPDIAFPRVCSRFCTNDVIVMELVHGVTIDHIRPEHTARVTRALREAFFAMCFDHGVVHADLHPGNLLVRDDGVVVLLDAGLVKYLSPETIEKIVDFTRCMVMGDAHDLVEHLKRHHRYLPSTDWDAVAADSMAFIARLRTRSIAEIEVSAVVGELFALSRKHHIRPLPELSLVLLGMVTIEGIAKRLDPTANTIVELARFLGMRMTRGRRIASGSRQWRRTTSGRLLVIGPEVATTSPSPPTPATPKPRRPARRPC